MLLRELATLQARIHHLKVPIRQDDGWLLRIIREWIEFSYEKLHVRELVQQFENQVKNDVRFWYGHCFADSNVCV